MVFGGGGYCLRRDDATDCNRTRGRVLEDRRLTRKPMEGTARLQRVCWRRIERGDGGGSLDGRWRGRGGRRTVAAAMASGQYSAALLQRVALGGRSRRSDGGPEGSGGLRCEGEEGRDAAAAAAPAEEEGGGGRWRRRRGSGGGRRRRRRV